MKPSELAAMGYHRFEWNGGDIIEYWKSIGRADNDFQSRIGIRFGEWKHLPFLVYLVWPSFMVPLKHIKSYEDLEELYRLVKWQEDIVPSVSRLSR